MNLQAPANHSSELPADTPPNDVRITVPYATRKSMAGCGRFTAVCQLFLQRILSNKFCRPQVYAHVHKEARPLRRFTSPCRWECTRCPARGCQWPSPRMCMTAAGLSERYAWRCAAEYPIEHFACAYYLAPETCLLMRDSSRE